MALFSSEKIAEILDATDIVDLVGSYVHLKRAGNLYKGLCPFHQEKTPSFVVTPQKGIFHCFGCGVGGQAIRFLMMITGLSFPEAVQELASRYGVELPEINSPDGPKSFENKNALYEVMRVAHDFFSHNLWQEKSGAALNYLNNRGLTHETIREFQLGLAESGWQNLLNHLAAQGFGEKIMLAAGLIKQQSNEGRIYDTFRDRLIVPISDNEGRVVAFGGRDLSGQENAAKYLNSPETAIYKKGNLLYGYKKARPFFRAAKLVFIVEGYFDLIALNQAGINEVVATLGTALTAAHLRLLRGQVKELILLFDGDEAGQRAASRALPLLINAELDGRVLSLPKGHDPDSFVREYGAEALYQSATQAVDIIDFYIKRLKDSQPPTMAGELRLAREIKEVLAEVPDITRNSLLRRRLAALLNLDEEALGAPPRKLSRPRPEPFAKNRSAPKAAGLDPLAAGILKFMIIHPECAPIIFAEAATFWPQDDDTAQVFLKLREEHEKNDKFQPEQLFFDDSEELSALMASSVMAERQFPPDQAISVARDLILRLRQRYKKKRQLEITAAIKEAQAKGEMETVSALLLEKRNLV